MWTHTHTHTHTHTGAVTDKHNQVSVLMRKTTVDEWYCNASLDSIHES